MILAVLVLAGTSLPWLSTRIPRAMVAEAFWDWRHMQKAPRPVRHMGRSRVYAVIGLWGVVSTAILTLEAPFYWHAYTLALIAGLALGALIDQATGLLPFRVSIGLGVAGLMYQSLHAPAHLPEHLVMAVALYAGLHSLNALAWRLRKTIFLGGGDIVLLACMAVTLPATGLAISVWGASLTGWIEARLRHTPVIRFGPHLAVAILSYWIARFMLA